MICLLLTSQISTRGRRSNSTFSTVILNGLQVGGERLVLNLPNKSFDKKTLNLILRKDSLKNYRSSISTKESTGQESLEFVYFFHFIDIDDIFFQKL